MLGKVLNILTILTFWSSKIKIYFDSQNDTVFILTTSIDSEASITDILAVAPVLCTLYAWEIIPT